MRSIIVCVILAAVVVAAKQPKHEQLRAAYDFHMEKLAQAHLDHQNAAQAKGVPVVPDLHAVVLEKEQTAHAAWNDYINHVRTLPGATEHAVEHDGKEFIVKPIEAKQGMKTLGNGNGHGNGHGNDHDDDDDDDHDDDDDDDGPHPGGEGNRLKALGRLYEQLLVNNTRTINAAVRLYNIANDTVCGAYMDALRAGRFDNNVAINNMLDVILSPNAVGTIQPNFHVKNRIAVVSYFMLACAANSSRVVKETFTSVIAWNNRVMYNMYFTLRAANGVDRLLTHVGEARVNPDGRVCGFKANFQRLGFGLGDAVLPAIANFDAVKISQNNTIVARCNTIQQLCPVTDPTLKQFDNVDQCYAYFSTLPNGGWERSDQRDRGCAFNLHLQFAPHRPDIHCVHVGPTGGGFCVPNAYNDIVLSDDQLWGDCV